MIGMQQLTIRALDATLDPRRMKALLDILTHIETFAELEGISALEAVHRLNKDGSREDGIFINGPAVTGAGDDDDDDDDNVSENSFDTAYTSKSGEQAKDVPERHVSSGTIAPSAPVYRVLHQDFITTFPGSCNLPSSFWTERFFGIVNRWRVTASFDKGTLGLRSTLASLSSSVVEALARARFIGLEKHEGPMQASGGSIDVHAKTLNGTVSNSHGKLEKLAVSWQNMCQNLIYGNLVDELFDALPTTNRIDQLTPAIDMSVEFACIK